MDNFDGGGGSSRFRRKSARATSCQRTDSPACMSSAAAKGNGMLTNRRVARPLERITCTFISYSACIISRLLHRLAIPFDMSLPDFITQAELFSTAGLSGTLFAEKDRYRLFAWKVYLALARARIQLEKCYCPEKGRVAIEPVLLLGESILQN